MVKNHNVKIVSKKGITHLYIDDIDISKSVSSFELKQTGGELPELKINFLLLNTGTLELSEVTIVPKIKVNLVKTIKSYLYYKKQKRG